MRVLKLAFIGFSFINGRKSFKIPLLIHSNSNRFNVLKALFRANQNEQL